jgi:U3 small nucleolar RNA-associated protein 14
MAKGNSRTSKKRKSEERPPVQADRDNESEEEVQDLGQDDESIDDDEAFNSDDERKYGDFFASNKGDDDDDDDESVTSEEQDDDSGSESDENEDSGEEEEGDGGQYMLDLLNKLDSANSDNPQREFLANVKARAAAANKVSESEFASSVVKKGNLTLDSLMDGLEDTKGFGTMQKSLQKIAQGEATQAPVAKSISKRAERKVHYESQAKEVSLWLDAVQQNRQAETLDFRNKERMDVTRENLIDKFVPTTDFEKAVHEALQEAGQEDEEAIVKAEEAAFMAQMKDDLGMNDLTMEEYQKRRGELAKVRALMFYHEQKRHRINKIKSKKYRRIRKKQRERAKESEVEGEVQENPDLLRELQEKEEFDRMKERMTLAHKNTSKWAKRILKRGKNVDADTRKALSAQLTRGDDLLQKMKRGRNNGESDDSESEDLVESARKVLQETEDADNDDVLERKGLFNLKFMQRGIEKQREIAKEEARQLLRELEANEKLDDYDEAVMHDSDQDESPKKKRKVATKESMKEVLGDGELVASSLKFGKSNTLAMTGGIDIDLGAMTKVTEVSTVTTKTLSEHTATMMADAIDEEIAEGEGVSHKKSAKKKKPRQKQQILADEANPWMSSAATGSGDAHTSGKHAKRAPSALKCGVVDVERVLDVLDAGAKGYNEDAVPASGLADNSNDQPKSITMLSQEELVRRAFASTDATEVEAEFAKEKAEVEDEDNDTKTASQKKKEKDMAVVSGWGAWAGEGAPPPRSPKNLPKHLQPPKKKEEKRKRQDSRRPNVIIREKRVKKTADKFMIKAIPYPFTSREEYERAMRGSVGKEWNVTKSVKDMTRPEIQTRPGKIIQPLSLKVKKHRTPAKF